MNENENEEVMSPDASPDNITKNAGTRRVNNWPMYMVGAALGIFILIMVLVAKDRADKQHQQGVAATGKDVGGSSQMFANDIAGRNKNGVIPASRPKVPQLSTSPATAGNGEVPAGVVQVAHPDLDRPPTPPTNTQQDNQREQMQQGKFQQFMQAVHATTSVRAEGYRSPGSAPGGPDVDAAGSGTGMTSRDDIAAKMEAVKAKIAALRAADPTAAFKQQLAMVRASGLIPGSGESGAPGAGGDPQLAPAGGTESSGSSDGGNDISQFAGNGKKDRWALGNQAAAPTSPFELRAGGVLPATLISGINSELPGQIMAQVSQNVYDTATGRYLLIPQGSRLIGTYASNVAYGQSRVLIAWQRIVFPDGKALDLGAMPGADPEGYAGYTDKVNNHYFRIFGSALLMSGITAGISYSQNTNQQVSATGYAAPSASQALSQALGQQLGSATAHLIEKNLNISPTIEIRPGYRFNVIVTKDLALTKPYQSFDY